MAAILTIDRVKIESSALFVEVLNLRSSGPRLLIAFDAKADDRMLNVVVLTEDQRERMQDWIGGEPERNPPPVNAYKGERISLTWEGVLPALMTIVSISPSARH